jgi:predicted porin
MIDKLKVLPVLLPLMILQAEAARTRGHNVKISDEITKAPTQTKSKKAKPTDTDLKLEISGSATVTANFMHPGYQYYLYSIPSSKDKAGVRLCAGDSEIFFVGKGKTKNDATIGSLISLDLIKAETGVDKMYVFYEHSNVGTFQLGNTKGPEMTMLSSGQNLIGGGGGLDGCIASETAFVPGAINPLYVSGCTSKATKIVYYSPRVIGFQFGVAYTPDTKHVGHKERNKDHTSFSTGNDYGVYNPPKDGKIPYHKNSISLGLSHHAEINSDTSTKISVVYLKDHALPVSGDIPLVALKTGVLDSFDNKVSIKKTTTYIHNPSEAIQATCTFQKRQWHFGFGYLNNFKSRIYPNRIDAGIESGGERVLFVPKGYLCTPNSNAGHAWNVGVAYKAEKLAIGAVYHRAMRRIDKGEHTTSHYITLTADYKIMHGLKIFAEITHIIGKASPLACALYWQTHGGTEGKGTVQNQHTTIFITGVKVAW